MPRYLIQASYTAEGANGVISEGGSSRRDVAARVAESVGGELECFYFAFGADDVVAIIEFPDHASAAAVGMTVAASGLINTRMTVLLTPDEIDEAAQKSISFRAPGR
jgi:uncharacterized protein with GYD domain